MQTSVGRHCPCEGDEYASVTRNICLSLVGVWEKIQFVCPWRQP